MPLATARSSSCRHASDSAEAAPASQDGPITAIAGPRAFERVVDLRHIVLRWSLRVQVPKTLLGPKYARSSVTRPAQGAESLRRYEMKIPRLMNVSAVATL
jgi:hypothetical protein